MKQNDGKVPVDWQPSSWRHRPHPLIDFYPYTSQSSQAVFLQISQMPPLVGHEQIEQLKQRLAKPDAFVLQMGHCAEQLKDAHADYVRQITHLIRETMQQLHHGGVNTIVPIARFAGQLSKPRTHQYEPDTGLLSYHGDMINRQDQSGRTPDPGNAWLAYQFSKKLISIQQAMDQIQPPIYISHESFLLPYEEAMTRKINGHWYNTSAHFLWLGYRSILYNPASVEYLRGVANPIGIKLGPDIGTDELQQLVHRLNPTREPGKLTIIYRFGAEHVAEKLSQAFCALEKMSQPVVWVCDPMHGNNKIVNQKKCRFIDDIYAEIRDALRCHQSHRIPLRGIHLESTAEPVNECDDHPAMISSEPALIDPRLNRQQTSGLIDHLLTGICC